MTVDEARALRGTVVRYAGLTGDGKLRCRILTVASTDALASV